MANKVVKHERYDKIRDKVNKRTPLKKKTEEVVEENKNTFMAEIFPIIIVVCLLIGFGVFYLLFNTYKEVMVIDSNGYFLNTDTLILGSKKTETDADLLDFTSVSENDVIYKNALNHYVDSKKEEKVNIQYPLFIDDGLSFINYNEDINLINKDFERSTGYSGLVISYGRVFDLFDYTQIDQEKYLLLSYNDDVMINLYDLKVITFANEYIIPVNSFVYFEENTLSYYERTKDGFEYKTINDMDFETKLVFYYDSANESYEYDYETFLRGIDTIYIKDFIIEEPVEPDKPIEEIIPPTEDDKDNVDTDNEFVWEKPSVIVSDLNPSVYSMSGKLQIVDKANVIVKEPTFTFYRNNKTFLRRTYYSSGDIKISGLIPNTTFKMVGTYTYLASDMQTRIVVTFFSKDVTTLSLDKLDPISLSFNNGQIFPKKIEVNDVKVTSDLENEALSGVNRISLNIGDKVFYLSNKQAVDIINGVDTKIESPESLDSSSKINYEFKLLDREGNELKTTNSAGTTRTSKRQPNVSLRLKSSEIDSVTLGVTVRNEDDIAFNNYIYVVKRSDGKIIKQDYVPDGDIVLQDLDPDQLFNVTLYADIDIDDGRGVVKNTQLASIDFTSKPITTLGYLNIPMEVTNVTYNEATIEYYINARKTNNILIRLLQRLKFDIYSEDGSELIDSVLIEGEDIQNLKDGNTNTVHFSALDSFTTYKIVITTIIQQGSTIYELGTTQGLETFMSKKMPARVNITSPFTTETMIDFDISIEDIDQAIQTDFVRLELRDKDNLIVSTKKIAINATAERVTYNNLRTNEFYNIYVYADGYNETHLNSTYKAKHLLVNKSIYTESGISGKIELVSSLRVPTASNLADVKSEVKWLQMSNTYNVPKTVDSDGNLHIYSKSGSAAYAFNLSEYHNDIVTVSFKIKAITPVDSNYSVYFTQYYSGTTSSSYSKKLTDIPTNDYKEFTYTFRVGSSSSLGDPSNILKNGAFFSPYYTEDYGINRLDSAGFYITGGTGVMSEYVIKDFEIHKLYDRVEYPVENIKLEQGSWTNGKVESSSKTASDFRVRYDRSFLLEGGKRYSFEYDNDTNYDVYFYLFKPDGTYEKYYGWGNDGYTFYIAEDRYVRVMFRYRDDLGTIAPEDIKNFRIYEYVPIEQEVTTEFEYDLVTKAKVKMSDKLDQIQTNDYYIKVYENGVEVSSQQYVELDGTVTEVEDVIKHVELDEDKNYVIELGFNYKERYYALSNFELSTEDEVMGISTLGDWTLIQPYGNYILLNDLNFQNFTDRRIGNGYRYFHGVIDFQGYQVTQATAKTDGSSNTYYYRMYRIETDAVLKNLVLDVQLNNQNLNGSVYGFVQYNYGTIENVMLNITDTKNTQLPQLLQGLLTYQNGVRGKIKNFVIKLNGDIHYYGTSGLLVSENYGTISNGYMYGGDAIVDFGLVSGTSRNLGLLTRYSGPKAVIENVFSTVNYKFPNNASYDRGGILAYSNAGTIRDVYVYGDSNPNQPKYGPLIESASATSKISNAHYISNYIYSSTYQSKASIASLRDVTFQQGVLGDGFNIDEMISLGYYPQVKFTSNKMPAQDFITLPEVSDDAYADIIFMEVVASNTDSARIKVTVDNPFGEEITDITIANLKTEIESQSFSGGKSEVIMKVSNPSTYTSKYAVDSITTISPNGYKSTRKYQSNELFLHVDLFRKIYTVNDFININKYNGQNFILMNDLDFSGYSNFYISTYSGIFDGNNHTISNVTVKSTSMSGLFGTLNGTIRNLYVDNFYKISKTTYHGLVGQATNTASFTNVHMSNVNIVLDETMAKDGIRVGGLVGQASQSSISYSSVTDITISSVSESTNISIGGLVGRADGAFVSNSYVQNADITVENAISGYGVGGFMGYEASANTGSIDHSYSTGKVSSNLTNSGGLVGKHLGYIDGCYSSVDVVSDMSFIGGISGNTYAKGNLTSNLYLGNLYSGSVDKYIHRISGNFEAMDSNFAMTTNLINGTLSDETYGEQLRTYQDFLKAETYQEILSSDSFDFSKSDQAVLPKLYAIDGETLLPNQRDNYLYKNMFNINDLAMAKYTDYASIVLTLDNPDNYVIKEITVEDAYTDISRNVTENGITQIQFELRPEKYFDAYRISNLVYEDEDGVSHNLSRNIRIDAIFYKSLAKYEDWQKISTSVAENYLLEADIDFSGKTDIKTNVMFNRLEATGTGTDGKPLTHTLKGIDLVYSTNDNNHVLIQRVSSALKNVKFENITITDTTTNTNNYTGLIMYNYGEVSNVTFKDVAISAPYEYYVAPITVNYGYKINDITLDNVDVSGKAFVAGLAGYVYNTVNDKYENINATGLDINATEKYEGGIFGYFTSNIANQDNPKYLNMTVKNSNILGTAQYVGGFVGYGACNYCTLESSNVHGKYYVGGVVGYQQGDYQYGNEVKDSHISGTAYYIGGVYGHTRYAYNMYVHNSTIEGTTATTHSVGGIAGYRSGYGVMYRSGILDSEVINAGEKTGGIYGRLNGDAYVYNTYVTDTTVSGTDKVGGVVGELYGIAHLYDSVISNSDVIASNYYAGGLVGYYYNDSSYGSYTEGYIREMSAENVNVKANHYAGGFIGGVNSSLYYASRIRRLYFAGTVTSDSGRNAGIATGDTHNLEVLRQSRIYVYEKSLVNGQEVKDTVGTSVVKEYDMLENMTYSPGYISGGVATYDPNAASAYYSDFIQLKDGKTYLIEVDYLVAPTGHNIYLYSSDKVYISSVTSDAVDSYVSSYQALSYYDTYLFTAHKDCYIRINVTNKNRVNKITMKEVTKPNVMDKENLLNYSQLRDKTTWVSSLADTSNANASKLNFSTSYWTAEPVVKYAPTITINDLTDNKYTATGKVTSISTEGALFDAKTNGEYSLKVNGYTLPSDNFTVSAKFNTFLSRYYSAIFNVSKSDSADGFGIFVHAMQLYVLVNNSYYGTGYYLPYLSDVEVTATFSGKTLKVYVNGNKTPVYTKTTANYPNTNSSYETFIGYNRYRNGQNSTYSFVGRIQNVKVYNRVLSADEVFDYYYNSSGTADQSELNLYYDFTNAGISYESAYPMVKTNTSLYGLYYQREIPLPTIDSVFSGIPLSATFSLNSPLLDDYIDVYPSGIDTINVEFKEISNDLALIYRINGKEYKTDVNKKVYTLQYDYVSDIEIEIQNIYESKLLKYSSDDFSRRIRYLNGNYYYLDEENNLYKNGNLLINDIVHLYNGLALLKDGRIYNLNTEKVQFMRATPGILNNSIPLASSILNDKLISTYYNYSLIDNEEFNGQLFIKDEHAFVFNTSEALNDNLVYGLYNTEEYQIVLNADGTISSYKTGIKYPTSFVNANIREITFDVDSTDSVIFVRYNSGSVLAFNYVTGEELFKSGETALASLFEYLTSSLSNKTYSLSNPSTEYKESKKFLTSLDNASQNNVHDIINQYVTTDNSTSNKLDSEYISVYNSSTNKYDIYNINEIVTSKNNIVFEDPDDERIVQETEDDFVKNINSIKVEPVNSKVKSNFVLYNYFEDNDYGVVKDNKTIIYSIIIGFVVINLFVLSYIYSKKEVTNEE